MKVELKTWAGLGLATALAGAGLAGCAGEGGEGGEGGEAAQTAPAGEMGEGGEGEGGESGEGEGGESGEGEGGEGGESGSGIGALPVPQRLAFMSGHVAAGIALYRAGEAEAAAPHLMHPVSEGYEAERAGLDRLGFEPDTFRSVSTALEQGKPAGEVEPQLEAAEDNLAAMREAAGGDPAEVIRFLMEVTSEEYAAALSNGKVSDAAEYQDAWGFVTVARALADDLEGEAAGKVAATLDRMLGLWPEGAPIPPAYPAPAGQVSALASRVLLDLPQ
ncbi:hypothetical protein [Erythrobacter sp.]|uniref:hypothetical protein n=1 Tax=Erythrobacter sp. TaxID=1042 RepID=UPI001425C400|nr:hypothetical protein [Erythrobacter sp.]QIQ86960.1 MAG: hypothetical protein G9473_09875 [Erythrobacter sp.]